MSDREAYREGEHSEDEDKEAEDSRDEDREDKASGKNVREDGDGWDEDDQAADAAADEEEARRYDSVMDWDESDAPKGLQRTTGKRDLPVPIRDPEMLFGRTASDCVDIGTQGPPADYLFGPFWQAEELAILFGATGTGKSALATQIAESVARGERLAPFTLAKAPKPEPQRVLYLDFELSLPQFAMRYAHTGRDGSGFGRHYTFSPNLVRVEMFWNGQVLEGYEGFSDMFFTALTNMVVENEVTAIVVDNITFLDRTSTTNANTALNIMRSLQYLKQTRFISILVLAHTPKRRPWQPLTDIDLQGSINLANFADSMFAVGRSRSSPDHRYLKQVKTRTGRAEFTAENVAVFELGMYDHAAAQGRGPESGEEGRDFLGFRFVDYAHEDDVLTPLPRIARVPKFARRKHAARIAAEARRLHARGHSTAAIAAELGISKTTAHRYIRGR